MKITCDSQGGKAAEKATVNQGILDDVLDSLNDYAWQDRIAPQLRNLDAHFSHITLGVILRFYHMVNVEKGNLRSLARYIKKDDKLLVDQMLVVDEYEDLSTASKTLMPLRSFRCSERDLKRSSSKEIASRQAPPVTRSGSIRTPIEEMERLLLR